MLGATTATTSTTTAPATTSPSTLPKSLSSPEANSTPAFFKEPIAMQPFTPGQCLLCHNITPNFNDSVIHMQKSHGLFVPYQQYLIVNLETLFKYMHLVIFGYRECIQCGTERATVQAVQQHMIGKGHCRFDISEQDSEFADFYDFSDLQGDDAESDTEDKGEDDERNQEETATSPNQKPQLLADEDSIRLPSGKIISRKSSAQTEPSFTRFHRRTRTPASQLEYSVVDADNEEESSKEWPYSDISGETRLLSRREKREKAIVTYQLANMSANDRNGIMHLSAPQQRSILATQHRHAEKVQKEERRRQSRIERKGNKNLYAYWATETPIYQCG